MRLRVARWLWLCGFGVAVPFATVEPDRERVPQAALVFSATAPAASTRLARSCGALLARRWPWEPLSWPLLTGRGAERTWCPQPASEAGPSPRAPRPPGGPVDAGGPPVREGPVGRFTVNGPKAEEGTRPEGSAEPGPGNKEQSAGKQPGRDRSGME